jgi:predicted nucleic-acid-binding protein
MKALDTNAVVRFLVKDDEKQAQAIHRILLEVERKGETVFVPAPVILETIWVLLSVYKHTRSDIVRALDHLLALPILEIEARDRVAVLCRIADKSDVDFADLFIGLTSRDFGCETTLTFDRKASKSDLFTLIA